MGKPAAAFFATALAHLHAEAAHTVMVGDDVETDVLAGQPQGLTGALVKPAIPPQHQPQRQRYPLPCPGLRRRPTSPAGATVMSARGRRRAGPRVLQAADAPW